MSARRLSLVFLPLIIFAFGLTFQQAENASLRLDENAALWYWRCFNQLQIDRESCKRYIELLEGNSETEHHGELDELREKWKVVMQTAEVAIQKPVCVFGIDREAGMDALLPHLEPMRRLAKMVNGEARRAISSNDSELTLKRLDMLCQMAAHTLADEYLLSALVSLAISNMAIARMNEWVDRGDVNDSQKRALAASIARMNQIGPAVFKKLMMRERQMSSQWMLERWHGPEDYDAAVQFFKTFDVDAVRLLKKEALVEDVQRFDSLMAKVVDAADAQDEEQLERLCSEAVDCEHGVIACLMIGAYGKGLNVLKQFEANRNELLNRLR